MITPVTHFLSATHLRRERLLPLEGRVLVSPGQNVSAAEVIAEAYLKDEHILIDVRQALGLPRQLNLAQFITRRVGERVEVGDILAQTSGIFRRVLRSPMPGEIIMISGGKIMLEVQRAVTRVLAGYHGEVTEVIENRGAIIEAHGALLQGVWGNGRIDHGMLLMPASAREIELLPDRFDVNTRGAVVFAGYCARAEALKAAAQSRVRGVALGSMTADLIPLAEALDFPILLLEGFGKLLPNRPAIQILRAYDKRQICLNAAPWDLHTGERPELFIPLPGTGEQAPEVVELTPGKTVRVIGAPVGEKVGVLEHLHPGLTLLATGLRTPAADVRLDDKRIVTVPLANLDVIE